MVRSRPVPLAVLFACGAAPQVEAPSPHGPVAAEAPFRPSSAFAPPRAPDAPVDPVVVSEGAPTLTLGALHYSEGPVRDATHLPGIDAEVRRNAGTLQRCWADRSEAAGLAGASITLHAFVGADGLVSEQCITEDGVGDPALLRCVNDLVAMGRYPVGSDAADVVFTFHFGAPAGG